MKDSYCLKSVTTFRDIHLNPLNTSTSKNLWSFAKDERFARMKTYCDNLYNIDGLHPSRYGVSIGKGKKSDFTKDLTASPGATRYEVRSFFDDNKAKVRGYSMGASRDVLCVLFSKSGSEDTSR